MMSIRSRAIAQVCMLALLCACGDKHADGARQEPVDGLPAPEQSSGSITGMPTHPGPGEVPIAGAPPVQAEEEILPPVDLLNPETGLLPGGVAAGEQAASSVEIAEPSVQDAVAVIGDYYASIENRSYARAYSLWSDSGHASGQSPQQFADGFAETAHTAVQIGVPGAEDAGAGQRHVAIPITVTSTRKDGTVHTYAGSYLLHRTVVDGASAEQRAWRIQSADLREVMP